MLVRINISSQATMIPDERIETPIKEIEVWFGQ